jgi:hypothetical protein
MVAGHPKPLKLGACPVETHGSARRLDRITSGSDAEIGPRYVKHRFKPCRTQTLSAVIPGDSCSVALRVPRVVVCLHCSPPSSGTGGAFLSLDGRSNGLLASSRRHGLSERSPHWPRLVRRFQRPRSIRRRSFSQQITMALPLNNDLRRACSARRTGADGFSAFGRRPPHHLPEGVRVDRHCDPDATVSGLHDLPEQMPAAYWSVAVECVVTDGDPGGSRQEARIRRFLVDGSRTPAPAQLWSGALPRLCPPPLESRRSLNDLTEANVGRALCYPVIAEVITWPTC